MSEVVECACGSEVEPEIAVDPFTETLVEVTKQR
jgi:hypothetical protein